MRSQYKWAIALLSLGLSLAPCFHRRPWPMILQSRAPAKALADGGGAAGFSSVTMPR